MDYFIIAFYIVGIALILILIVFAVLFILVRTGKITIKPPISPKEISYRLKENIHSTGVNGFGMWYPDFDIKTYVIDRQGVKHEVSLPLYSNFYKNIPEKIVEINK